MWNQITCPPKKMWHYTRELKPAIQIVLLHDTQFIKSRSAMAVMDGAIAGARSLARDWEHFRIPGVVNYKNKEDFKNKLNKMMCEVEQGMSCGPDVESSWKFIQANHTHKAVNEIQYPLIQKTMSGRF